MTLVDVPVAMPVSVLGPGVFLTVVVGLIAVAVPMAVSVAMFGVAVPAVLVCLSVGVIVSMIVSALVIGVVVRSLGGLAHGWSHLSNWGRLHYASLPTIMCV